MGRHTHAIPVPFKIEYGEFDDRISNWDDGGESKPLSGWVAVGWAYDVKRGGDVVYAIAVEKNPSIMPFENEQGCIEMPEDYKYDEKKLVFLLDEDGEQDWYVAFAMNKATLEQFCKDFDLDPDDIQKNTVVKQTI